jgi:membrane protease YdiL (CAAX protease family)
VVALVSVAITTALWLQGVLGKPMQSLGITLHAGTIMTIVIGVQMCIAAPVVEEIFFRGLLYRALRNRLSIPLAALIARFLFGAIHGVAYPLDTLPPRLVFGGDRVPPVRAHPVAVSLDGAPRTDRWWGV